MRLADRFGLAAAARARARFWARATSEYIRLTRAELLTTAALLAGWACLTRAAARLVGPVAWDVSVGLFLLSLVGWRFLWTIASHGLYTLTRDPGQRRG